MNHLSCENAIYEDVKAESSHEGFNIHENKCYGKVTATEKKHEEKSHYYCYSKVIIMVFVIVFSLLLGTAGTCVAFAVQIVTLKSEIESLKMTSSYQSTFTDSLEHLEEVVHQLNVSDNMLYLQLSQDYTALDNRTQQLNTPTKLLFNDLEQVSGQYPFYPTTSCAALPPSSTSGYYWVRASNGSAVSVYCDMTLSCGGVTGGWMRVAELDMTNRSHQCPSGLTEQIDTGKRVCVRIQTSGGCSTPNNFIKANFQYSNICGRVIGYQIGSTDAFYDNARDINGEYVDGVSLTRTHGNLRHHIWTFAAGFHQLGDNNASCPCNTIGRPDIVTPPPDFVGEDYFCDSGNPDSSFQHVLYGDNPLWDGAGCRAGNTCCSFNNPPWFYKRLPQPTTDNIEVRVCRDEATTNEDIAVEIIEILVQ